MAQTHALCFSGGSSTHVVNDNKLERVSGSHVTIEHDHVIHGHAHLVYKPPLPSLVVLISPVVAIYDKQ